MGQPKAKWGRCGSELIWWRAKVGPFQLIADARAAEVLIEFNGDNVWQRTIEKPCDLADLMRLAESELERRLRATADTMDGSGLVAEHVAGADCSVCEECGAHCQPIGSMVDGRCAGCRRGGRLLSPGEMSVAIGSAPQPDNWLTRSKAKVDAALTRLVAGADTLNWICEFDTCDKAPTVRRGSMSYCDAHAREHDENVARAEADCEAGLRTKIVGADGKVRGYSKRREAEQDPYQRAALAFSRLNPPCTVCGESARLRITNGEAMPFSTDQDIVAAAHYQCGHTEAERVRGSRDWAVAMMHRGNSVTDVDGNEWLWLEHCRQFACAALGMLRDAPVDEPDGWRLPML